jgi:hypothetical protein
VPEVLVAETLALCKKTNSIGLKRKLLIKEIAKQRKQSTNRLVYMDPSVHPQPAPNSEAAPQLEAEAAPPPAEEGAPPQAAEAARPPAKFVLAEPVFPSDDEVDIVIRLH